MHAPATLRILARAGLWSGLAFVLHLAREIAHVGLYTIGMEADGLRIAWSVFHCSLGDAVIALAAYALAGMVLRQCSGARIGQYRARGRAAQSLWSVRWRTRHGANGTMSIVPAAGDIR